MFNIWNEEEPLIKEQYSRDNYIIADYNGEDAKPYCVIYFSSNGLYYPNTEENFAKFMADDRFEWRRYHFHKARREIYVRDIYKQWYIKGINSEISSIDKLIAWISQNVPKGCDIITVGNSAGGYMAVLAACLLGARYAYDFSGQFNIEDALEGGEDKNSFFKREFRTSDISAGRVCNNRDYLDLKKFIYASPDLDIFYFYPALCEDDKKQAEHVADCGNIHPFLFRDDKHGETMYNFNLDDVFAMEPEQIMELSRRIQGKIIGRTAFSLYVRGAAGTFAALFAQFQKKLFKR